MTRDRYCSNCRAPLPDGAASCPSCGVYAGDLYDERAARRQRRQKPRLGAIVSAVLGIAAIAAAAWWIWSQRAASPEPPAPAQRPLAAIHVTGEAQAVTLLRRHLIAKEGIKDECIALIRKGRYAYDVVNSCDGTRLGRWRVDPKSSAVEREVAQK